MEAFFCSTSLRVVELTASTNVGTEILHVPQVRLGMVVVGNSAKGRPLSTVHSQTKFEEALLGCARPPTRLIDDAGCCAQERHPLCCWA